MRQFRHFITICDADHSFRPDLKDPAHAESYARRHIPAEVMKIDTGLQAYTTMQEVQPGSAKPETTLFKNISLPADQVPQ